MTVSTSIPLVDLKAQYRSIADEVRVAMDGVLERGDFVMGEALRKFEAEFASYCGSPHALGVASGTDALHLACRVLGIGEGDEVILPAFTFVATALGVTLAGGKPVLVDVDPDTALIDVKKVAEAIGPKTKAILPVHLYGQVADMDGLLALGNERGIPVIEDAAQAHGAELGGRRAGSMGAIGCFSFYPGKNLGAYGDGGAVTFSDPDLKDRLNLLRNWGSRKKYHHEEPGMNSRLDTLQAAILRVKLARLDGWNEGRRRLAAAYDEALAGIDGVQLTRTARESAYHLYVIRVANRDEALTALQEAGIGAGLHYPFPVHSLKAYSFLGYQAGDFPVSEDWGKRCLSLPIYAEMPEEAVGRAAEVLSKVVKGA